MMIRRKSNPMTPYSAPGIVGENGQPAPKDPLTELLVICCMEFSESLEDVTGKCRKKELVDVRVAFCHLASTLLEYPPRPSKLAKRLNVTRASAIHHQKSGIIRLHNPSFPEWNRTVKQIQEKYNGIRY